LVLSIKQEIQIFFAAQRWGLLLSGKELFGLCRLPIWELDELWGMVKKLDSGKISGWVTQA